MEDRLVTLDVGGTVFTINSSHLLKCEFFRVMFEDVTYEGEKIYIDRSSHIFKHVLSYLRDCKYPLERVEKM